MWFITFWILSTGKLLNLLHFKSADNWDVNYAIRKQAEISVYLGIHNLFYIGSCKDKVLLNYTYLTCTNFSVSMIHLIRPRSFNQARQTYTPNNHYLNQL